MPTSNLIGFHKIGSVASSIQLSRLDDGDGIENTLNKHSAKWHDSCRLWYNKTELQRAVKRRVPPAENAESLQKYAWQSKVQSSSSTVQCFSSCDKPARSAPLHEASTFDLNEKVRKCAIKLEDTPLLATLSTGDRIAQETKRCGLTVQQSKQCEVFRWNGHWHRISHAA